MNNSMKNDLNIFLALILISFFLVACGAGSGEGLEQDGEVIDEGSENTITLNDLVSNIFDNDALGSQRCTNCHSGGSPLGGMNLETAQLAYANLVGTNGEGVNANGNASFKRVQPGNPDESYIILKLEGDPRAGSQMPLNQTPLTPAQLAMVRDWIANGAAETGVGTSPTMVSKITPLTNSEIQLHFSRELASDQDLASVLQIYFIENSQVWLASPFEYEYSLEGKNLNLKFNYPAAEIEGYRLEFNTAQLGLIYDIDGEIVNGNQNQDKNKQQGGVFSYEYQF